MEKKLHRKKEGHKVLFLFLAFAALILGQSLHAQITKTIGSSGQYKTINDAFTAINKGSITGNITLQLISSTTETNFSKLNASGIGNANYNSVTFYPTVSGLSINGNLGASLIEFVGCKNVTIDGRVNKIGPADLTISNTGTSISSSKTFYFHDGASNNVIRYCNIKGSNTGSSGAIISFEASIDVVGNNNNTIEYCNITNSGSRATIAVLSSGSLGKENTGNIISNNNFYDFFAASDQYTSCGILIFAHSTDWTITGNSFYETTNFSPIANNYLNAIRIATGNNHIVSNNYIGGKAPQCGGGSWNLNLNATSSSTFYGIYLAVGTTTASSVQNNLIKNINLTTAVTNTVPFCGIYVGSGKVNIGTIEGNTIGSSIGTGSIVVTNTNLNTNPSVGISVNGPDAVFVENNSIGSLALLGSPTINHNFRGITSTGTGVIAIKNNSIGSSVTRNSISTGSSAISSTNAQSLYGILSDGNGTLTISNNTMANLNNAYEGILPAGQIIGINILNGAKGANTIESNTIRHLSNASPQNNSYTTASVVGISQRSTVSNQTIAKNKISNLKNTSTGSKAVSVFGIFYTGGTAGTNTVSSNFIQNLSSLSSSTSSVIAGIRIDTGVTTYSNNIISLDTGISTGNTIYGIYDPGTSSNDCKLFFNTVYIGGSPAGGSNTFALYNNSNLNTRDYRNNIFFNARTNASGNAKHYAIRLAENANLTINNNDYFVNGSGGVLGNYYNTDKTDLSSWRTSTTQDINSVFSTPDLISAGGPNDIDYKPKEGSFFAAANGTGTTTDYSNYSRRSTPSIGAYEQSLSINGSISFCGGSNNALFTLTGSNLSVIKWQSSADAMTWFDIENTTTTYNAINITSTTYYRAVVQFNTTSTANSSIASLTVSPLSAGGSIAGTATVCSGTNTSLLNLSGYTGTIVKWQSSVNGTVWSDIANTSTSYAVSNLNTTTYYRAVIQSGNCSTAYSNTALVTVNPLSTGGTVSGGMSICSLTNSTLLTLTGNTGAVIKWQSSQYGTNWSDIINTNATYNVTNQINTMYYRAVVQSGNCATANSSSTAISVIPSVGGTLSGAATVCSGTNEKLMTLTSEIGDVVKWQSSLNNTDWTDIANANTTYTAINLTATTYFRVVVQSDICLSANSNSIVITVNPSSIGGAISGGTSVCTGTNSTTLTLTGKTGTISKWQSSLNENDWIDIANTSPAYTVNNLTTTTYYRAVVISGLCLSANSATAVVTVNTPSVAGIITGGTAICFGSSSGLLSLTGNSGNIIRWERSVSPFSAWTPIAITTTTYTSGEITETTQFRAVVQNGTCLESNSNAATVTVASTTWNGFIWSNGVPTSTTEVIFTGNALIGADLSACSIRVSNNAVVSVTTGFAVTLSGAVTVDAGSSFTLNNNSNLIQSGATNLNKGNVIVIKDSNALKRLDYTLWSSPVTGVQSMIDFSPVTNVDRFYEFRSNQYFTIPTSTTFTKGKGFLIRMPNSDPIPGYFGQTATLNFSGKFIGVPNNGTVSITGTSGQYAAVGNPYPSTISASAFIIANQNSNGTLYFWRKPNNKIQTTSPTTSYATYTLAGGIANGGYSPTANIAVGQGFITMVPTTGTIVFTNAMRVLSNSSQFLRIKQIVKSRIWLNLLEGEAVVNQMMIAYMEGATSGIDSGIDGKYFNDSATALTSNIDGEEYIIQGRALPFDSSDTVPLNFKTASAGTFTIAKDYTDGLFAEGQEIFLVDSVTGIETNIQTQKYTFTSTAGIYNSRFSLKYQKVLGIDNLIANNNNIKIYKIKAVLTVTSREELITAIQVYDLQGKLISEQKNINRNIAVIKDLKISNQVIIVKVFYADDAVVTKKVLY